MKITNCLNISKSLDRRVRNGLTLLSGLLFLAACSSSGGETPGFTLTVAPGVLTVAQGSSGEVTVTVNRTGGFQGEVVLGLKNPPDGVSAPAVTLAEGAGSGVLSVSVGAQAVPTSSTVTVQGTSGSLAQQASFILTVTAASIDGSPSSFELINGALEQGIIDYETALSYKVYAVFGDERLPEAYRGDDGGLSGTSTMSELVANLEGLSPATQAALQPFLLTPPEPGSWYEPREGGLKTTAIRWGTVSAKTAKVKVWWDQGNFPEDAAKAQTIVNALDSTIWPKLTSLMKEPLPDCGAACPQGGGDDRLDIYLVFLPGVFGYAYPFSSTFPTPGYISVRRTIGNQAELLATVAHELMHTVQYAYEMASFDEYSWLMEATATWAEDYVYPDGNTEHGYAASFLTTPETPLETANEKREYGAYLFFFYLHRQLGQAEIVRRVWENAANASSLAAVNTAIPGGFQERWPEFARLSYNHPPINDYSDWDDLKWAVPAKNVKVTDAAERPLATNAKHLAAIYWHVEFTNPDIRSISFENPFASGSWPTAKVQALVKIAGRDWTVEDWTGAAKKGFCRDKAEEDLERLVLIVSNSEWQNRGHELGAGTINLSTQEDCFVIDKVEGPAAVIIDGPPGDFSVYWKGNPTFPVDMILKNIACGISQCQQEAVLTYGEDEEGNPLAFQYSCFTLGGGGEPPPPGSVAYEVRLKDSKGLETPPTTFTVSCQYGGGSSLSLPAYSRHVGTLISLP